MEMQTSRIEPFVEYESFRIVHSPGTKRPRLDDGFTVHRAAARGGDETVHTGPAEKRNYQTESQALIAAHARAKAWIDAEMSKSD